MRETRNEPEKSGKLSMRVKSVLGSIAIYSLGVMVNLPTEGWRMDQAMHEASRPETTPKRKEDLERTIKEYSPGSLFVPFSSLFYNRYEPSTD